VIFGVLLVERMIAVKLWVGLLACGLIVREMPVVFALGAYFG